MNQTFKQGRYCCLFQGTEKNVRIVTYSRGFNRIIWAILSANEFTFTSILHWLICISLRLALNVSQKANFWLKKDNYHHSLTSIDWLTLTEGLLFSKVLVQVSSPQSQSLYICTSSLEQSCLWRFLVSLQRGSSILKHYITKHFREILDMFKSWNNASQNFIKIMVPNFLLKMRGKESQRRTRFFWDHVTQESISQFLKQLKFQSSF